MIEKLEKIIDEYLKGDDIYPDFIIKKYYSRTNSFYDVINKYAETSDENRLKYTRFINTIEKRKKYFIDKLVEVIDCYNKRTINALDIELISGISINSFKTALNKPENSNKFGKQVCLKLSEICNGADLVPVQKEIAYESLYIYKGKQMSKEDIDSIYDYLINRRIVPSINNITYVFQKMINGEVQILQNKKI